MLVSGPFLFHIAQAPAIVFFRQPVLIDTRRKEIYFDWGGVVVLLLGPPAPCLRAAYLLQTVPQYYILVVLLISGDLVRFPLLRLLPLAVSLDHIILLLS